MTARKKSAKRKPVGTINVHARKQLEKVEEEEKQPRKPKKKQKSTVFIWP